MDNSKSSQWSKNNLNNINGLSFYHQIRWNLDYPTGFAAWGLGLQVHQDVVWQQPGLAQRLGVLTTGDVVLNTTFGYEAILPDDKPFRVCDIHQPICPNFDPHVRRDVGDIVEAEVAGGVHCSQG